MPSLSENAKKIIKDLYAMNGETVDETFRRVAKEFAIIPEEEVLAYTLQKENIWRCNTPVYFNAGTDHPMYSACWVVGLDDSMNSIYDVANVARKIFQHGAGIGIPIGNLRAKDSNIYEGKTDKPPIGRSSGPISFMKLYDAVGETTKSGGRARRAAILCAMQVWHPDIIEFISCKEIDGRLSNMNISVSITDSFMKSLETNTPFQLLNPANGEPERDIPPGEIWDKLTEMAWKTADPGLLFIDTINKYNPLKKIKLIECTNPCVVGDTFVSTPSGYKKANVFKEGDDILTVLGKGKVDVIEKSFHPVYQIDFSDGGRLFTTKGHQFHAIKFGFGKMATKKYTEIPLSELEVGDWVRVSPSRPPNNFQFNTYGIDNYSFGLLLGILIGDGCITESAIRANNITISSNQDDEEWNKKIEKLLIENKIDFSYEYSKTNKSMKFCIKKNDTLSTILNSLMLFGNSKEKRIPEILYNSNEEILKGLLDGYISTDGNVNLSSTHPTIKISSANRMLVHDLRRVLLMFNIHCSMGQSFKHRNNTIEENGIKREIHGGPKYECIISGSSLKTIYNLLTISNIEKQLKLQKAVLSYSLTGNIWKAKILSIKYIGEREVIDLHEPVSDTWITEGYVSRGCGEQPLLPDMSCNLSSINVSKFIKEGKFDFKNLYRVSYEIMGLMDNIIDRMMFPDDRFKDNVLKYRPVGIGIMGLADVMFELDIKYDSVEGKAFAGEIMKCITTACVEKSTDLAATKGPFFEYDIVKDDIISIIAEHTGNNENVMKKVRKYGVRNIQFTTCQPTGTTALTADASYGIEPSFGLVFQKTLIETGEVINIINPIFKKRFEKEDWYNETLLEKVSANGGSLKGLHGIPKKVRDIFVCAHDIKYKDRIDLQAELQKYCSSGISSTVNLPNEISVTEVSDLYKYAYEKGLKGITIYRDGCKRQQPITFKKAGVEVQSNFERPAKLPGQIYTVETGNGKLYVTVTSHNNRPVEVFLSMGKSGQFLNVFGEALGRLISIALQHGVSVEAIVKTMKGINSDRPTWFKFEESDKRPAQILSIPDAIAKLLEKYYMSTTPLEIENYTDDKLFCSKCGTHSVILIEGCKTCLNCSESACG